MSKNKLIPELRFPEFKNEGEWKESVLGSVVEMKGRIGYRGYTTEDIVEKGKGAITLSPSNFNENGYLNFDKCTYISWDKYEESPEIQLEEGHTVLVKTASVGKTAYVEKLPEKATVNPQIVVLKPQKIHNRFLAFTVSHLNTQNQIRNNVGAGAIPNISQEIISKIKILLPPDDKKKEQQKIASCLSSLDEVIAAHSQKLELLKDHKKGLMQNLFPQEGEKVPKLRFKEFEKDWEWVEKPLDDICKLVRGPFGGALKKEIFVNEGYAVYEQSHAIYSDFSSFRYFIDEDKFNELKRFSVKSGDLIMSCSGTMGKFAIVPKDFKIGVINQALLKLTVKKGYDILFVKMTLEADNNQKKLLSQSAGGAIKNVVSVSQIKELGLFIPSIQEQQKIASCLSSLDALITAEAERIAQLKLHKMGLMQGLFPKIED